MLTAVFSPAYAQSDTSFHPYVAANYDAKKFKVTRKQFTHGQTSIEVIQAVKIARDQSPPWGCRAWLLVAVAGRPVFQRYFDDIEAVGDTSGLFVPSTQLPAPFFAVLKIGDYNGRLFLIRDDGRVFDIPGGSYFLSPDRRRLLSDYHSDESRIVVFDLKTSEPVFESKELPSIHNWYELNGTYAFTESEWRKQDQGSAHEKEGVLYHYDAVTGGIVRDTGAAADLKAARPLKYTFDPHDSPSCTTAP
jgi:hypothetical protein